MSLLRTFGPLVLTLALTEFALGDIRPVNPRPTPEPEQKLVPVKIVHAKAADLPKKAVARIVIPRHLLPELKKAAAAAPSNSALPAGTIIAGLALSAAAVSLIFLFPKNRRPQLAVALIGCVILTSGYALYADLKFPGQRPNPKPVHPNENSQIQIVVQDNGTEVILTLPRAE